MFQIEPILWLQSLESPFLTWVMQTVTNLGYTPVYASLLIVLIFGVRLRYGFYVFLAMLISGILTDGMKRGLHFPRPSDIDRRVIEPGNERPPLLIDGGAARDFWSLPSSEAMSAAKIQVDWSYGFPSGHVAAATAFFLALAFFFRSKGVFIFAICWIVLMALSRMYLGRHFIADVIAGMGVGLFSVFIGAYIVRPMNAVVSQKIKLKDLIRWASLIVPLVILAPWIEILDKENIGRLFALFAAYAFLVKFGMPNDEAKIWKRILRVLFAIVAYVIIDRLVDPLMDRIEDANNDVGLMIAVSVVTFLSFVITIVVAKRLNLFEKQTVKSNLANTNSS